MRVLAVRRILDVGLPLSLGLGLAFLGCDLRLDNEKSTETPPGGGPNGLEYGRYALAGGGDTCDESPREDVNRYAFYYMEPRTDMLTGRMDYTTWNDGHGQLQQLRSTKGTTWQPTLHADPSQPCGGLCLSQNVCAGGLCYPHCMSNTCSAGTVRWAGSVCYCAGAQVPPGTGSGSGSGASAPVGRCAWTHIGPTNVPGRVLDLSLDQGNPSRMFAATVGGLWRTSDAGRSWERISDDWQTGKMGAVAVNPALGTEVMAGSGDPNHGDATGNGVYLSQQSGNIGSWSNVLTLTDSYVNRIQYVSSGTKVYVASSKG